MLQLKLQDFGVGYRGRSILHGVTAAFSGGEMVAVIGRNGVGKTTLIKGIAGLLKTAGSAALADEEDGVYSRKDMAYVPQLGAVTSRLTVFETVLLGLVKSLRWRVSEEQTERVTATLKKLHLYGLSGVPVSNLSGGQKQLVFMAQALVSSPRVLLLDEPTSALDLRHQLIVLDLAKEYTKATGAVTIFVLHDLMLAARYADRLLLLQGGGVRAFDTPENVLLPELISDVYRVEVEIGQTPAGFYSVIPTRPLPWQGPH